MRIIRIVSILVAFALLAIACGDDGGSTTSTDDPTTTTAAPGDDADESSEPATTEAPVELTASWTGVTEDTIRLGFTVSDLIQLREIGLVDLDRGDPQLVLDALIDDVNARGGVQGRMLDAHLEVLLPIDATAADEACVRMTEDIQVFAVLSPFAGPNTEVNPCINSRNETIIVGGQPTAAQLEVSAAPWISHTMAAERRLTGTLALMEGEGLLGDTVGVAVTAEEQAAADDIVIPWLEDMGKTVVLSIQDVDPGDAIAGEAAWSRFIELWRTEEVDSVVMVENTGTFGSTQLARSDLDANFLIVDSGNLLRGLGALDGAVPEDLDGIIGSAGPSVEESFALEATQDCIRAFEEANPDIEVVPSPEVVEGESDWFGNINVFCPPLRLFELVANAAGPNLTHETFLAAAEGLGQIDLPGQTFASLGPDKLDAADAVRLTVFDATVGAEGGEAPFGPLERID
ncbi:MAG: hypothetical protein AAF548_19710 [Actinomycetota bacterium]